MHSAVAVGTAGDVHISYHDAAITALRYARRDQSGWTIQVVDASNIAGQYTSIVLDSFGLPHIGYAGNIWRYAYYDGATWNIDTIVGYARRYSSLALDKSGNPHLSSSGYYYADLFYAFHNGISWQIDVLIEDYFAEYSSIAVDDNNYPHIAYLGELGLMYTRYDGTSWQTESATGQFTYVKYPSLRLDEAWRPCIGYYDHTDGAVEYAAKIGSVWGFATVDDKSQGIESTSLSLDPEGHPHICYHGDGHLKHAHYDGAAWHIETVDDDGLVGSYCSMAMDSEGFPHISYYDETNSDLKYAYMTLPIDMELSGDVVAGELVLTWSQIIGSAEYWVYGSADTPYFIPGFAPDYANRVDQLGPNVFTWSSPNGIGSMETNWTYLVIAVDDVEQELARSNRIGEHDEVMDLPW
jgi:hypothetical protein